MAKKRSPESARIQSIRYYQWGKAGKILLKLIKELLKKDDKSSRSIPSAKIRDLKASSKTLLMFLRKN